MFPSNVSKLAINYRDTRTKKQIKNVMRREEFFGLRVVGKVVKLERF